MCECLRKHPSPLGSQLCVCSTTNNDYESPSLTKLKREEAKKEQLQDNNKATRY